MAWHHLRLKSLLLVLIFVCAGFLLVYRRIYFLGGEVDVFHLIYDTYRNSNNTTTWQHPLCGCWRPVIGGSTVEPSAAALLSSCGPAADVRGTGQKVVSYSFYGDTNLGYFRGVDVNTETIKNLYDGWVVRLYHNISPKNPKGTADLCRVICNHSILDDCYVGDLKIDNVTGNMLATFGMLWRFAVMGDPLVDLFAVRDLDSPVHQREVDAVDDWIAEGTTWHIMRDNPVHYANILGGMWGGNNRHNLDKMQRLRAELFSRPNHQYKTYDQQLLSEIVWPEVVKNRNSTAHDSFLCLTYPYTKPWPTRRVNRTFVGDMYGVSVNQKCPPKCRPADHQDWTYC